MQGIVPSAFALLGACWPPAPVVETKESSKYSWQGRSVTDMWEYSKLSLSNALFLYICDESFVVQGVGLGQQATMGKLHLTLY